MNSTNGKVPVKKSISHQGGKRKSTKPKLSQLPAVEQAQMFLSALSNDRDSVFEVRILDAEDRWRTVTLSGYFRRPKTAAQSIIQIDQDQSPSGCYVTINRVNPDLIARANQRIVEVRKGTTTDVDIVRRTSLLIDIDPVRPRGISSSHDERAAAKARMKVVVRFLREDCKWPEPLAAIMSGNGYQLLYALDLQNDVDAEQLIKQVLQALAARFSDAKVVIDQSVTNASRIGKIPGTTARKGDNTTDRPHRMACLMWLSNRREIVSAELLQAAISVCSAAIDVAQTGISSAKPTNAKTVLHPRDSVHSRLLVERYLEHYAVQYKSVDGEDSKGRRRWALETCPFHDDHGGRDCVILQEPSGKLGFKCLHNRCMGKSWQDVRAKIGPPLREHFDLPFEMQRFQNYQCVTADGKTAADRRMPMASPEIAERLSALTGGFPKRVGRELFVLGPDGLPMFLDGPKAVAALFAWVERFAPVSWQLGADFVPKDQFFAYLQMQVDEFDTVELFPHFPQLPRTYYAHQDLPEGDGSALEGLLDRLCPLTDKDRELARGAVLTSVWGGPLGKRPGFIIAGPLDDPHAMGRGTGKTSWAQNLAEVVGGYLSFSTAESHDAITTRLFSPEARFRRIAVIDNVKTARLSSAELEALITSSTISGRRHYVGEGRRPNSLVWIITMNGGKLSKDLAQRCVMIRLARPKHDPAWDRDVGQYIEQNRWKILADAITALKSVQSGKYRQQQTPGSGGLTNYTRWATWEAELLSTCKNPAKLQTLILERQAELDDDDAEMQLVRDHFRSRISSVLLPQSQRKFRPDDDVIFLPNRIVLQWVRDALSEPCSNKKASSKLELLGIPELRRGEGKDVHGRRGRGWRWTGSRAKKGSAAIPWPKPESGF